MSLIRFLDASGMWFDHLFGLMGPGNAIMNFATLNNFFEFVELCYATYVCVLASELCPYIEGGSGVNKHGKNQTINHGFKTKNKIWKLSIFVVFLPFLFYHEPGQVMAGVLHEFGLQSWSNQTHMHSPWFFVILFNLFWF